MKSLLAICLFPLMAFSAELPPPILPAGVGVNIHFTKGREQDLDLIAAAGFKFIRMDFGWGGIERKKGEYDWSAYDELTANLEKRGLRAVYILDYSNGLYEESAPVIDPITKKTHQDTASPQHPESVAAFARWAAEAVKHYRGRHIIWEIWNEPNISFWKPKPDAQQYATLALAVGKAVREADPQATLVAPASSEFPWPFFEKLFASGALRYLDAVSVHPYRHTSPETAAADYLKLRGLIAKYAPEGKKNLPVLSGEWGYSTQQGGETPEKQAAYLARQQLSNLLNGVPLSIWYDWKNDGLDPKYNEHNFGTVDHELKPKPSYVAVKTLTREMAGYRIARRLAVPGATAASADEDYVLLCVNDAGDHKLAAWTMGEPHPVALSLELATAAEITAVDGDGGGYTPKVQNNQLTLDLAAMPKYISLRQRTRGLAMEAAWSVQVKSGVLVEAGKPGAVRLAVELQNPFPQKLRVALSVDGWSGDGSKPVLVDLPPQRTVTHEFRGTISRRDAESVVTIVHAEFQERSKDEWATFQKSIQRVSFVIANPLKVSLAPVAGGMQLRVENPSGESFHGTAKVGSLTQKISLDEGTVQAGFDLQGNISGSVPVSVTDAKGHLVVELSARTYRPIEIPAFKASLDGDKSVPATASIKLEEMPAPAAEGKKGSKPVANPYSKAFRLDYNFSEGWRFARCVPELTAPVMLAGKPQALGMWVYGDGSGNGLRLRVRDEGGQTFQPNGPAVDWTGWRWIVFDLSDLRHTGHWGGAKDGVVHGVLQIDCPLLLDAHGKKTQGSIWFAGLTLILAD